MPPPARVELSCRQIVSIVLGAQTNVIGLLRSTAIFPTCHVLLAPKGNLPRPLAASAQKNEKLAAVSDRRSAFAGAGSIFLPPAADGAPARPPHFSEAPIDRNFPFRAPDNCPGGEDRCRPVRPARNCRRVTSGCDRRRASSSRTWSHFSCRRRSPSTRRPR